jgi:hypothetical protein
MTKEDIRRLSREMALESFELVGAAEERQQWLSTPPAELPASSPAAQQSQRSDALSTSSLDEVFADLDSLAAKELDDQEAALLPVR